jgi:iron complex outermembrane recepter protein
MGAVIRADDARPPQRDKRQDIEGETMGQFTGAAFQGARARVSRPLRIASFGLALPLAFVAAGARATDNQGAASSAGPALLAPAPTASQGPKRTQHKAPAPAPARRTVAAGAGAAAPAQPILLAQATPTQGGTGTGATGQANPSNQPPPPAGTPPGSNAALSEVVVTGSRIERSTFTTPNPVTVLNSQDIANLGITNVGEVLGELPQNSNFFAANNVGLGNFNVGAQLANLRGLNPFFGTRTLTLVDTERFVPQATGGGVDVTLIPSMLVARTEVVTGGASAVYGSDAVAGVVNIILDKKLQGFKGQADYGQTSHHDGGDPHVSIAYGTDLGSRAHIIMGGEFENSEDIGICSQVRSWCASNYGVLTNTLYNGAPAGGGHPAIPPNGLPHYIIGPNATLANQSQTGVLTPCTLPVGVCIPLGPQWIFNSAGNAVSPFNPGNYADGAGVFGFSQGAGATGVGAYDGTTIKPSTKRYTGLADLEYKITDNLNAFLQFDYARSESVNPVANGAIGPIALEVASGVFVPLSSQINYNNPFLPAQFKPGGANALSPPGPIPPPFCAPNPFPCGNSIGGALLGYNMNAIDPARNVTHDHVERLTGGMNGEITGTWNWDAYFEYGQNYNAQALFNNVVSTFLQNALDVVTDPATGQPVCASGAPGCVPLDLFGSNNANPAALAYAFRTLYEFSTLKQYVISGNVHGDLFGGIGAGPVKIALGVEARRDTADVTHDLQDQPFYDEYFLSYGLDYAGKIDVAEGYTEIDFPVLKDLPFAKYLDFDGAIRETSNTNTNQTFGAATDGESVTHRIPSWKLSGIWDTTDWLRIRGTRSRDVRAPYFRELYETYAVTAGGPFGTVVNPVNQQSEVVTALTGGNINLEPETADTETVGIVLAPKSGPLNRFQFSTDWYKIVINNPIAGPPFGLGVQNIVNLCYAGQQAFCNRITFGTPGNFGTIQTVNNTAVNLGRYEVRGVDFEADYSLPLPDVSKSLPGNLNFRWLTSLLYNMTIDDGLGSPPVDYAGQSGPTGAFGGFNTSPRWQSNFFVTYNVGRFTGTAQVRWIGPGSFEAITAFGGAPIAPGDAGYSSTNPNSINTNSVASATYLDLFGSYDITDHVSLFTSINNVFNKSPPVAPGGNGYPTNPVYFDTYGLFWRVGVRVAF